MNWHVDPDKAAQLNLREAPKTGAVIVTLPQGTNVVFLSKYSQNPVWWLVDAKLNDDIIRGFVHSNYLKNGPGSNIAVAITFPIPPAHLNKNGKKRTTDGGRAFPLDEASIPAPPSGNSSQRAARIIEICKYLAPGKSSHKRYKAGGGKTYCNIYAYDFSICTGLYLPRVWWMANALENIRNGITPPVVYGNTVREMNANMLHDWFIDYGAGFGWKRAFNADDLQEAANQGKTAIIVAKRTNLARSGHIVGVPPEHGAYIAARNNNVVVRPVQSQAGSSNFTFKVTSTRWWLGSQFQSFGFWIGS